MAYYYSDCRVNYFGRGDTEIFLPEKDISVNMKIAFIHSDKKIGTGAHFINDLIACKLREKGTEVNNFYPQFLLTDTPIHFKGINNILFFYSLLEKRLHCTEKS